MTNMQTFDFEENAVRSLMVDGEPWFVGRDVCTCLEISNSRHALSRLDDDEKGVANSDTLGGNQQVTIINEPGVYNLVFTSRSDAAKRFKRWLAHDVLPTLRRTGRYDMDVTEPEDEAPPALPPEALDKIRIDLAIVREARVIWGREAARSIWAQTDLPLPGGPPGLSSPDPLVDARACLAHLLRVTGACGLLALADDTSDPRLRDMGMRVSRDDHGDWLVIARGHPALERAFAGTPWDLHRWRDVLLRGIPGAVSAEAARFNGHKSRTIMVPMDEVPQVPVAMVA